MRLGLFSVSYAGLWGQKALGVPAFIEKAAALGYEGVLLMAKRPHLSVLDSGDDALRDIKDALARTGISLIGLAAYNDFTMKAAAEVPVLEMQVAYIRSCLALTRALGGSLVRVFTGYERGDEGASRQWDSIVAALKECGRMAEAEGLVLAVQNHHDLAVGTDSMERLLAEVGMASVRAGYDAWSPALRGEELEEGAYQMARRAAMTIAADYEKVARWRYVPSMVNYERAEPDLIRAVEMGTGFIDYRGFFSGLERGGFEGWAVYEMCSPVDGGPSEANLDAKAAAFLSYMHGINKGKR
jgi:sugar phosphate isomerase/epimerase